MTLQTESERWPIAEKEVALELRTLAGLELTRRKKLGALTFVKFQLSIANSNVKSNGRTLCFPGWTKLDRRLLRGQIAESGGDMFKFARIVETSFGLPVYVVQPS